MFYGKGSIKELFSKIFKRFELKWVFLVLLIQILVYFIGFFIYNFNQGFAVNTQVLLSLSSLITIPIIFCVCFVQNIWEEIAWRGFLLEKLTTKYSLLISSVLIGILWGAWHLPLLLNPASPMNQYNIIVFFVSIIFQSITYSYLYISSKRSVLAVTIFHSFGNALANIFTGQGINITQLFYYQVGAMVLITIALVIWQRNMFASKAQGLENT
jgi:membrane protease YdiL (CAAX protease family)